MGKIPNGIQQHVLWQMDGRIWIENYYAAGADKPSQAFQRALDKGYVKMVPQDKLIEFVRSIA